MTELLRGNSHGRLARLLAALMRGEVLDRHSAAALVRVNHEGAYRMLDALVENEVPGVEKRRRGRRTEFYFDRDAAWPRVGDTKARVARALAVAFGAAFAKVFAGTDYEHELRRARDEVIASLSAADKTRLMDAGRKIYVLSGSEDVLARDHGRLDAVLNAVLMQRVVRIEYQRFGGNREMIETPLLTLLVHSGKLYVVGRGSDHLFYPYRFARILSVEPTGRRFDYPSTAEYDPKEFFRHSFGVFVDPEPCRVVVRLDARWKTYAHHHHWHSTQRVENEAVGTVKVSLLVRPCAEVQQWILSFGETAEVLEPAELRGAIARRLAVASGRYSG